jgi:hypothetical protein
VAQEDPEAVGGVGIAGQVCGRGRGDFHAPAQAGVPGRQALPDNGCVRESTDSRSTSDEPGRTVPLATDP